MTIHYNDLGSPMFVGAIESSSPGSQQCAVFLEGAVADGDFIVVTANGSPFISFRIDKPTSDCCFLATGYAIWYMKEVPLLESIGLSNVEADSGPRAVSSSNNLVH